MTAEIAVGSVDVLKHITKDLTLPKGYDAWAIRTDALTVPEAIQVVARTVAADSLDDPYDHWDGYPEIGEHDWINICAAIQSIADDMRNRHYREAYALLAARAEGQES